MGTLPFDKAEVDLRVQTGFVVPQHVSGHVHTSWSTVKGRIEHKRIILRTGRETKGTEN